MLANRTGICDTKSDTGQSVAIGNNRSVAQLPVEGFGSASGVSGGHPAWMGEWEVVLVDPWWDLRGGGAAEALERDRLVRQLASEVAAEHPLHACQVEVVGACLASDDVLVRLEEGRWALVHLTYGGRQAPPWPATYIFEEASELAAELALFD